MISVIVPAYNVDKYLARCIDSVLEQTCSDLELLLIDDGSTDLTGSICEEYAAKDKRVRVIHKENAGVSEARNTGLDEASGDMIAFADADDRMEPDMLKILLDYMLREDADMVSCGYYEEYADRTDLMRVGEGVAVLNKREAYEDFLKMGGRIGSGCWNKLFKARVLKDVRYKSYITGEDVEMISRILDRCERVVCVDKALYHYIHRESSASRKAFGPANIDILHAADDIVEYISKQHEDLLPNAYSYHAAWYSAQIQVMYLQKDVSVYSREREYMRSKIREYFPYYAKNKLVSKTDLLYITGFKLGCYRPLKALRDIMAGFKR